MNGQRDQVLSMLRASPSGVTTGEFIAAGIPRFSARLNELRALGYAIPTGERVREGQWRYQLATSGTATPSRPPLGSGRLAGAPGQESASTLFEVPRPSIYNPYTEATAA